MKVMTFLIVWSLFGIFVILDFDQYFKYMKWISGGFLVMLSLYLLELRHGIFRAMLGGYWLGTLMLIVHLILFTPEEFSFIEGRAVGLTNNSNSLGFMMVAGIICAVSLIFNIEKRRLFKIILLSSLGLFLVGLILSASRKSFLSLAFFIVLFYYLNFLTNSKNKFLYLILFGVLIIAGNFGFQYIVENTYFGERLSDEQLDRGFTGRVSIYENAFNVLMRNLVIGVGQGNAVVQEDLGRLPHSDLMSMALGSGLVGLFFYLRFYWVVLKKYNKLKKVLNSRKEVITISLVPIIIAVYFLIGLGRENYTDVMAMPLIAMFFAYMNRLYLETANEKKAESLPRQQYAPVER
jgi:O-antigen ligase